MSFITEKALKTIAALVLVSFVSVTFIIWHSIKSKRRKFLCSKSFDSAYCGLVGRTPIVELSHLSRILKSNMIVKMESHNPGGTGKDRAAKHMLFKFRDEGLLKDGGLVVEGTSGSTGIALAGLCKSMGYRLLIVMPDDQAVEKRQLLERLGATVHIVPCCSITNVNHYVNKAKSLAKDLGGVFVNQFENESNWRAHFDETGPEIWSQTKGCIDAFVMSAGTGGTIAGVSRFLKAKRPSIQVVLADPQGSSLHSRVTHGVCFTSEQAERSLRRHRYDSIVEGVGLDRVTANFEAAVIDRSERVSDQEAVEMAHWLLRTEGLFVGSSSAINVVAACRVARRLGPGCTVVTVICDNGQRHLSRFWNPEYVTKLGLVWPGSEGDQATGDFTLPLCLR